MENKYNEIIGDMCILLLKASGSLEGEDQRLADEIDGYIQNVESYEEQANEQMFDFLEWAAYNYIRLNGVGCHKYAPQTNKDCWITTDKLFEVFKYKQAGGV